MPKGVILQNSRFLYVRFDGFMLVAKLSNISKNLNLPRILYIEELIVDSVHYNYHIYHGREIIYIEALTDCAYVSLKLLITLKMTYEDACPCIKDIDYNIVMAQLCVFDTCHQLEVVVFSMENPRYYANIRPKHVIFVYDEDADEYIYDPYRTDYHKNTFERPMDEIKEYIVDLIVSHFGDDLNYVKKVFDEKDIYLLEL